MPLVANLPLAEVEMAPQLMQQFAAYVGIDWADRKHDFCLQAGGEDTVEFGCFPHRVECIDEWARALHQRFGGPIAVALELAKGPIVSALQKYDFFTLFPINPSTLAKYRLAFKPESCQGRSLRREADAGPAAASPRAVCAAQTAERRYAIVDGSDRTAP